MNDIKERTVKQSFENPPTGSPASRSQHTRVPEQGHEANVPEGWIITGAGTQFGEYYDTCVGTDLTLEWDSTDPQLHEHLLEGGHTGTDETGDTGWNVEEAGIPDA